MTDFFKIWLGVIVVLAAIVGIIIGFGSLMHWFINNDRPFWQFFSVMALIASVPIAALIYSEID